MNVTSVRVIKRLLKGDADRADLAVGVKRRQAANVLADLEKRGYAVSKGAGRTGLPDTPKAVLLRDAAAVADIEVLLRGSNEDVLAAAASGATAEQIAEKARLSSSTVQRSVADLRSIGALRRDGDAFTAEGARRPFPEMARLLQLEKSGKYSGGAEILYSRGATVIRKVPAGAESAGRLTGFSAFKDYGVECRTAHDFYCERERPPDVLDVLLHAVLSSKRSGSRHEMAMCAVFYTKHRDSMDSAEARRRARVLGVVDAWLDVGSYVRGGALRDGGMFLPWKEFLAKADVYGIRPDAYELPRPHGLFEDLGRAVKSPVTAYLLGGENMRMKGLKDSTKDCDIVAEAGADVGKIAGALRRLGYAESGRTADDLRARPMHVFEHPSGSRVDVFERVIGGKIGLSAGMKRGAQMYMYGNLRLGLLADEHVFLAKAVTGREGDVDDMAALARGSDPKRSFDWNAVLDGVKDQIRADPTREQIAGAVLYSVLDMGGKIGAKAPILDKLRRLAADVEIRRLVRGGGMTAGRIVSMLRQDCMGEALIRNRINALARGGQVSKRPDGRAARVGPADEAYPHGKRGMTARNLEEYLRWRFCALQVPSGAELGGMAREMEGLGFSTVGKLDSAVRRAVSAGGPAGADAGLGARGAVRACVWTSGRGRRAPKRGADQKARYP